MYVRVGFTRLATSRHFRREREKGQKPPPARTQRVHTKRTPFFLAGPRGKADLTNSLRGFRFSKAAQLELEQAVRREVADFAFRRWN